MLACWRLTLAYCLSTRHISGFDCRAASVQSHVNGITGSDSEQQCSGGGEEEEEDCHTCLCNSGSMVSAKKPIGMVRKWQRQAAMGRVDRISLPRASLHDFA